MPLHDLQAARTVLVTGDSDRELLGPLWYKVVTGFFAAIPGVMLLLNNTLKFEDREISRRYGKIGETETTDEPIPVASTTEKAAASDDLSKVASPCCFDRDEAE